MAMQMQPGDEYEIGRLCKEAQTRWLKPPEILSILQNHERYQLTHTAPQQPPSGSLFLFDKRVIKFFRKDGYQWRRKKDGRAIAEAHERLKVGSAEALNCYYAHGELHPAFQRRSYWMLDPEYEHIVLVHYRDVSEGKEGKQSNGHVLQVSPPVASTLYSNPSFTGNQSTSYNQYIGYSTSLGTAEVSSDTVFKSNRVETPECSTSLSEEDVTKALKWLEAQLSIGDDSANTLDPLYTQKESLDSLQFSEFRGKEGSEAQESESWKHVLGAVNSEGSKQEDSNLNQGDQYALLLSQELGSFKVPACYSAPRAPENNANYFRMMGDEEKIGLPLEQEMRPIDPHKKMFVIHDISPEWGYANETTKVIIVGSFLCDPTESTLSCMFGSTVVPFEIVKEGVIRCEAPPCGPGKVKLCIASGDGLLCSEIKEFEYRSKPDTCPRCSIHQTSDISKTPDELLLLVRLVQTLKADEDQWSHLIEAILDGSEAPSATVDWLLQELLKDKLEAWLSLRPRDDDQTSCSLSRQEQGIIHMVAGLGFEWALYPILDHGVSVDFRDINGWSALHWAARFGSEKMVAALIASGASAGAVTDPTSQDPVGKTAASIAASNGYKGLAGYLSEVALTNHLSSLTLEETEISKDSAQVQAEITVNSISAPSPPNGEEDQLSMKETLAAIRNAAQAAARIQAAFRAHSFRKRQQRESALAACLREYGIYCEDIEGISAMSKLNVRNYHSAALSIQKKYRGYKRRKEYLGLRQKVVKIQAHVRGYQTRKQYKVLCWAVGVLDKAILRWRRKGVGLRGFRNDVDDSEEEEDILKVFRKKKVDEAVKEAFARVLSMANSHEARQQYTRVLKSYCQRKAELGKTETLGLGGDEDDDDALFDIADMEYDTLFSLP